MSVVVPEIREPIKTPLTPSTRSHPNHTFHTLTREAAFLHPPKDRSDVPALDELVAPHIESFNALFESPDGGPGLLALAIKDVGEKVVFDGQERGQGNRLSSESRSLLPLAVLAEQARSAQALDLLHWVVYPDE